MILNYRMHLLLPTLMLVILTLVCNKKCKADLNGLLSPIYVTNSYTFTDGERADGFVSFLNGFDLPTNGTITLNLSPGCMISGEINMNGGTIKALSPVILGPGGSRISGNGFLNIPNLIISKQLTINSYIFYIGTNATIKGLNNSTIEFSPASARLDFSQLSGNLEFQSVSTGLKRFVFQTNNPLRIIFDNWSCNLDNTSVIIPTKFIDFFGKCEINIDKQGKLTTPGTWIINPNASVTIGALSKIQIGGLILSEKSSQITLNNASFDFLNSSSIGLPIQLGDPLNNSAGQIIIQGRSILKSSGIHDLLISTGTDIIFGPSSKLELSPNVHLSIY